MIKETTSKKKLALSNLPIWVRQPAETAGQFMWFSRYMEARLNGESMAAVCKKYGKKEGYAKVLGNWAYPNQWTLRIEAYRDFLEQKKAEQRLKDIETMNERQQAYGRLLQRIAMTKVDELMKSAAGVRFTAEQIVKWLEAGVKIERVARGSPSEITAEAELPEETRKRLESIYKDALDEVGDIKPDNVVIADK